MSRTRPRGTVANVRAEALDAVQVAVKEQVARKQVGASQKRAFAEMGTRESNKLGRAIVTYLEVECKVQDVYISVVCCLC